MKTFKEYISESANLSIINISSEDDLNDDQWEELIDALDGMERDEYENDDETYSFETEDKKTHNIIKKYLKKFKVKYKEIEPEEELFGDEYIISLFANEMGRDSKGILISDLEYKATSNEILLQSKHDRAIFSKDEHGYELIKKLKSEIKKSKIKKI